MTSNTQHSGRILGRLRAVDGRGAVLMQDRFDTDVADLWAAVTEPARLARWLGEVTGELSPGRRFTAHFFASGWEGTGQVIECHAPHRFVITTIGADDPDEQTIEVTLRSEGGQTVLSVEERGMPLDELAAYGAGLQVHVEDLAAHLVGRERCDAQTRWSELIGDYRVLVVPS